MSRPLARSAAALAAAVPLLAPALARAAEEGGHGGGFATLVYHAINLLLLVGVVAWFARRPIQAFMAERRAGVVRNIETSEQLLREAQSRLDEWQRRLANLDTELREIREASARLAEVEREEILREARALAERIRADARAAVQQEVERARAELRREAADLAVEIATELLREQVGEDDRTRLVDEFVETLERGGRAPAVG